MRILVSVTSLLAALLCSACVATDRADNRIRERELRIDALRAAAAASADRDNVQAALETIQHALRISAHLRATDWRTVENYDEAGLYYYLLNDWQASARHQAVAVLLACVASQRSEALATYVQRLGWTFARYRPGEDFAPIAHSPLLLLQDDRLNLSSNADVRRQFFELDNRDRAPKPPIKRIYRLKRPVPTQCTAE